MNLCDCREPIVDLDDLSCALCGRSTTAALVPPEPIPVDPLDAILTYRRRLGFVAGQG